ncbi:MAG: OpgC domain-containing protein, partial [Geminicoccaceae bacterium]|nr:OpgC domain-containing protein [Geminicoccaceae bacterium]
VLGRGWIAPPPIDGRLAAAALVFILLLIPVSRWQIYTLHPLLQSINDLLWLRDTSYDRYFKTNEHPIRYLHLLALTYVAVWAVRGREHHLRRWPLSMIEKVGQQALATFVFSMALAWALGVVLDEVGRGPAALAAANIGGLAAVIAVAYVVGWYKSEPWRRAPQVRD